MTGLEMTGLEVTGLDILPLTAVRDTLLAAAGFPAVEDKLLVAAAQEHFPLAVVAWFRDQSHQHSELQV